MVEDLETTFTCPFCNSERSCTVELQQEHKLGKISCAICGEDFKTSINYLTEPLDVYNAFSKKYCDFNPPFSIAYNLLVF